MSTSHNVTIKDDSILLVTGTDGNVADGLEGHGLYLNDTRYLSTFELLIDSEQPHLLSHTLDYNIAATFRLSITQAPPSQRLEEDEMALGHAPHAIGITRQRYIKHGLIESITFTNYYARPIEIELTLKFGADFADIFEVRGMRRDAPGHTVHLDSSPDANGFTFRSQPISTGSRLRTAERTLRVESSRPCTLQEQEMVRSAVTSMEIPLVSLHYTLNLLPNKPTTLQLSLLPDPPANSIVPDTRQAVKEEFRAQVVEARRVFTRWQEECTRVSTGNYVLDKTFETGTLDLRSLMQRWPQGLVVTAGIPWYFTIFGRDSIITALETLSLNPQIAKDTLRALAAYQATEVDDWRDSEPGKILHELRVGDTTLNNETPHSPYYGSVDSTLLFILLFSETFNWTGDTAFYHELWPNVERALQWAWQYGDLDGDGFIEYSRRSRRGILHQGWKDSDESMGGTFGPRPSQPVALVEVQGYYFAALVGLAAAIRSAGDLRQQALADSLEAQATALKEKFNRDFWCEDLGFFAQALDSQKQPVRSITSNIGHCLWNGIIDESKAPIVVKRLMQPDMLSGWGVRTLSTTDPTYNPMSYHNGSVWPHDNALLAAGLRRYNYEAELLILANQLFDAAATFPDFRLPELYCGFPRGEGAEQESAPAGYPVSCSPQAWAAGTPMLLLQSLLGLRADPSGSIHLSPLLPPGVNTLELKGLTVGLNRLDLVVERDISQGTINWHHVKTSSTEPQVT